MSDSVAGPLLQARRELAHPHPRTEWFSGPVSIQELSESPDPTGLEIFAVFFDPGARTMPHTHSTDQLLYFLEGEGIVATRESRHRYLPGGMAVVPANAWHWHGAIDAAPACHLSIRPGGPRRFRCTIGRRTWPERNRRDDRARAGDRRGAVGIIAARTYRVNMPVVSFDGRVLSSNATELSIR
jgi:quercetin dioxygenase-like cupin family protein